MVYISGSTGEQQDVAGLSDLIKIADRVKREKEYGATFLISPSDCAYITFSTDLYTKDGEYGGFCLLWSNGNGYKALKPFAYKSAEKALKTLYHC